MKNKKFKGDDNFGRRKFVRIWEAVSVETDEVRWVGDFPRKFPQESPRQVASRIGSGVMCQADADAWQRERREEMV
jgi:hypothetical protein